MNVYLKWYGAAPAAVNLAALTTLDGAAPANDQFTYTLTDSENTDVDTKTNVGGNVAFDPISFNAEGTYTYYISQETGSDPAITYDAAVYTITVAVTKNLAGQLTAAVTYKKDGADYQGTPLFENFTKKINIPVSKVWDDASDQDGKRPTSVVIKLIADGVDTGERITLSGAADTWTGEFTGMPEYKNGVKIVYSVEEETAAAGYTTTYGGNAADGFIITNFRTPATINVYGSKTWNDNNNINGKRPQSITIRLYKNNVEAAYKVVTAADGWVWDFGEQPMYASGQLINYTVTEDAVAGYTATYSGYNVTNTYTPDKISVQVTKTWQDDNNRDGLRPSSVTVRLLADGVFSGRTLTLSGVNSWTGIFADLPNFASGRKIVYTVEELSVGNGYSSYIGGSAERGFNIINSRNPATFMASGSKTWDDNNNEFGKRPQSITVRLYKNGRELLSKTVTAADFWTWAFPGLSVYEDGVPVTYTISEDAVPGYTATVRGFNITNTYTAGKTSVHVIKTWLDDNNKDGLRPQSVTVKLYADGFDTGKTLTLSERNNWTGAFANLDIYNGSRMIIYTVTEASAGQHYSASVSGNAAQGFIVTNVYTPPVTPEKPEETTEPEEPTPPSDPIDPEDPTDLVDPSQPEDPSQPADPIDSIDKIEESEIYGPPKPTDAIDPVTQQSVDQGIVPKTGDNGIYLWLSLLLISTAGVLLAIRKRILAKQPKNR